MANPHAIRGYRAADASESCEWTEVATLPTEGCPTRRQQHERPADRVRLFSPEKLVSELPNLDFNGLFSSVPRVEVCIHWTGKQLRRRSSHCVAPSGSARTAFLDHRYPQVTVSSPEGWE